MFGIFKKLNKKKQVVTASEQPELSEIQKLRFEMELFKTDIMDLINNKITPVLKKYQMRMIREDKSEETKSLKRSGLIGRKNGFNQKN